VRRSAKVYKTIIIVAQHRHLSDALFCLQDNVPFSHRGCTQQKQRKKESPSVLRRFLRLGIHLDIPYASRSQWFLSHYMPLFSLCLHCLWFRVLFSHASVAISDLKIHKRIKKHTMPQKKKKAYI
jgi:hypothetical protein